jgi:hypothetical protein
MSGRFALRGSGPDTQGMTELDRLHIRVLERNEDGTWLAVGELDDGTRMPAWDVWGVMDLGDGISAALNRGVELRVSEEVYAEMQSWGDAWYPRPGSVRY